MRLNSVLVCLSGLISIGPSLQAQNPPAQPQTPPAAPAQTNNPFEAVPQSAPAPQPGAPAPATRQPGAQPPAVPTPPQFETPKEVSPGEQPAGPPVAANVVEAITFRGTRRVPQDTLRAMIRTRAGDIYSEDALRADFMLLWNTNRFDDIQLETEKGERGGVVVTFVVTERRVIRDIKYEGR